MSIRLKHGAEEKNPSPQGLYWLGTLTTELQAGLQETLGKLGHFTGFISDIIEGHPIPH